MGDLISIALTKGRIEKGAIKLLEQAGFGVEELKDKGRRYTIFFS